VGACRARGRDFARHLPLQRYTTVATAEARGSAYIPSVGPHIGRTSRGGQSSGRNANTHLSASARKECRVLQEMHYTHQSQTQSSPIYTTTIADCITAVSLFVLSLYAHQVLSLLVGAKCFMAPAPIPSAFHADADGGLMLKGPCAGIAVFIAFCSNLDTPRVHQNIGVGTNLQFCQ